MNTKWRLSRNDLALWTDWFSKNSPICQVQEIWRVAIDPKDYFDKFWKEHYKQFRRAKIKKEEAEKALFNALALLKIYPFKDRKALFIKDFNAEFCRIIVDEFKKLGVVSLEDELDTQFPMHLLNTKFHSQDDVEDELIAAIDMTIEDLEDAGYSVREIAEITGESKSSIHRKLQKERRK